MRLLLWAALSCLPLCAQVPPAAAKPRPVVPARIREFKAESTALQPGQSTTISWVVENPTSTTITGFGNVTAIGNRRITPLATTTYMMTVKGAGNSDDTRTLTITVAGTTPVAAGANVTEAPKPAPHIDGRPDMSGIYNSSSFSSMFGGRATVGENTPFAGKLKPGAEKYKVVRGPEDTGRFAMCTPTGVPGGYFVPYQWQIVQGKDFIVILYEYPHLFRSIPIGNVQHPEDPDPTWMGNSVAHWEGDTLVVDVVGFNDKTELPGGFNHSEALHVVERFTRIDSDNLKYVATIEDPNVFVEPWTIERVFPIRPDLQSLSEFVCENNRDYKPLFEKK
ncbi:MAG: hypothetical protein ABIR70_20010 [Bryobacteraceae bacterium]